MNISINMKELVKLNVSGIYCLKNDKEKFIQIYGSINVLGSLTKVINSIDTRQYDLMKSQLDGIDFLVLEETKKNNTEIKICLNKWIEYYEKLDYSFYKDYNVNQYKVKEGLVSIKGVFYYTIFLKGKKKSLVVGLFDSKDDAVEFKNKYYKDNKVNNLVYSDNRITQEQLNNTKNIITNCI